MCVPPKLIDLDLEGIDTVAVDLETYDPGLKDQGSGAIRGNGFVCGIAIATGKDTYYFPIRHAHTDNIKPEDAWPYLNEKLFQNSKIKKVFHNAMYDVCWIRAESGLMPQGPLLDTMVAASVIDENRMRYSLDSLSNDYLSGQAKYKWGLTEKTLTYSRGTIKDPMTNMHKLDYPTVKEYAEQDVKLTLKLWEHFDKKLDKVLYTKIKEDDNKITKEPKNCRAIFKLETELFPCLVEMRFKGVRIDVDAAKKFGKRLNKSKNSIIDYIERRTSVRIEIWAASSIKKLLDKLNIKDYKTTPKSKLPQLPKDYLKTHKNHFIRLIAKAREFDKAEGTFVEGLLKFVYKGRIHADINQIRGDKGGTVTGRFSMSNPNLQQIPAKGFIGKKMRALFIPEEGCSWGSFDYSQQEPRIVVHYAVKLNMSGTKELVKSYKEDPKADFHKIVADMAQIPRPTAKTINLGLFYGMGKNKLAQQLNLDSKEANALFKKYHEKVPFVKQLSSVLENFAREHKLLFTLGDRFCRFDKWEPMDKRWDFKSKKFVIRVTESKKDKEGNIEKDKGGKEKKIEVNKPVPLLTEDEARIRYSGKEGLKAKYEEGKKGEKGKWLPDPEQELFEKHYQPAFIYRALNKLVQGSAADMTKKAMVLLYKKGILPHIQIHDELCISIKDQKQADIIKETMEKAIELVIDNKVDYEFGPNWGNIK